MEKKKEKSIETPELLIKGNIMCWEGTMVQLSNISCISTMPLEQLEFPKYALLLLLGGFIVLEGSAIFGIFLLVALKFGSKIAVALINTGLRRFLCIV